jgi:hypothetical protein
MSVILINPFEVPEGPTTKSSSPGGSARRSTCADSRGL